MKKIKLHRGLAVECKTTSEKLRVLAKAMEMNIQIGDFNIGKEKGEYPNLSINDDFETEGVKIVGLTPRKSNDKTYQYVTVEKFLETIKKYQPIEVKLNDEYTAKVFADKIVVKCQTISIKAIEELNKAIKKKQHESVN